LSGDAAKVKLRDGSFRNMETPSTTNRSHLLTPAHFDNNDKVIDDVIGGE